MSTDIHLGRRALAVAVPERLGTSFRWLLASSWVSNIGDGIAVAAGPLLVASQTDSPGLVALAATMIYLPPFLVGLLAGVVTDRVDRRKIVVAVNIARCAVLGVLAAAIVADAVSIAVVLAALFLLGVAETFGDSASAALLPMLVHRDDLATANTRLQAGFLTMNQLAGPPLGALLFALGSVVPFVAYAVLVALSAILVTRVATTPRVRDADTPGHVWREVVEGVRWTWHHAAVRTLVVTIFVFNTTFGAAWSVLVLYSTEHLGLGEVGFGLVTTVGALGGIAGTLSYGWLTRRISLAGLMRIGLVVETFVHLGLALTHSPWVAMAIFFVFGAHAFIWGTTSITIRQRAVPEALQGRVGSVNVLGVFGGMALGSMLGGVIAEHGGLTAPFWFAFAGSAVLVCAIWPQLHHIAHADDQPTAEAAAFVPDAGQQVHGAVDDER
ncbi:MFS transporter [Nocardioides sp. R-C-SC26]|uniref:MFS transporter n=1 Tax=Nocardioides sp. R-C-SC26 TaxID=2870414 RepID=UPI001E5CFF24|nr:MFS transporter [Nocardioides sp. R-C-SC26]